MAFSLVIRNDRHADRLQKEATAMITQTPRIRNWSRVVIVVIALVLTGGQSAAADMTRPSVESGGIGAEVTSAQAADDSEARVGVAESSQPTTFNVIVDEAGNVYDPEMVAEGSMEQASSATTSDSMFICFACSVTA